MKNKHIIPLLLLTVMFTAILPSCNDSWNEHYENDLMNNGPDIMTTLNSNSNLSTFVKMIEITGLNNNLAGRGAYTVWAPDNASLADISLTDLSKADSLDISNIVKNHISRYYYSTSTINSLRKKIVMLNGKYLPFIKSGSGFMFGEQELNPENVNTICSNGILHVLNGQVPFRKNIWENIAANPEFAKINNIISRYDTIILDMDRSERITSDSAGNNIYDSVYIVRNSFMTKFGSLTNEDSVYTFLAPTNEAYQKTYDEYKTYFKSNGGSSSLLKTDSVTNVRTESAIVSNLIFIGDYNDLGSDSIQTTSGNVFHNPSEVLMGNHVVASNGTMVVTDSLRFNIYESLYHSFDREPEDLYSSEISFSSAVAGYVYTTEKSYIKGISGAAYLYFAEASDYANPSVSISLGNKVLSADYDIYCTIVPGNAEDSTKITDKTILDFKLTYNVGKAIKTVPLKAGYVTNQTQLENVLVQSGVKIPFCDCNAALSITINVPRTQRVEYKRSVRIDKIRLVPTGKQY